jgi:hypothetical protein
MKLAALQTCLICSLRRPKSCLALPFLVLNAFPNLKPCISVREDDSPSPIQSSVD